MHFDVPAVNHVSPQRNIPLLYDPTLEHDACGVGLVAHIGGCRDHRIVALALEALRNLEHRGAVGGDEGTGDGAGIMLDPPDDFFRAATATLGIGLPPAGRYAIGMFFLPRNEKSANQCRALFEEQVARAGLLFLGRRPVPCDTGCLGGQAAAEQPWIEQAFVGASPGMDVEKFERTLYLVRRRTENTIRTLSGMKGQQFAVASLSARTLVYKGLLTATQLPQFYPDLRAPSLTAKFAIFHQRYSTNTFPSWELAQPFNFLAHNGEINTLRGNLLQMRSREPLLATPCFSASELQSLFPIIQPGGSDSAALDNAFELLRRGGRDAAHAMLMLIPEAWGVKYPIGPDLRGFFEYHAGLMEPWDGPAAVVFSDGLTVGAILDRNGLRPARYTVTRDDILVLASEAGVLDQAPDTVIEKGALRPGQMLRVDFEQQRLLRDGEIKSSLARRRPYRRWVEENRISLHGFYGAVTPVQPDAATLAWRQRLFHYTREDFRLILEPMASRGHEPVGSMGMDTPPAILSEQPQLLYDYFKQLFAQVTNPAIDPIREELVMTLMTFMGNPGNVLSETPNHARLIKLWHPILTNEDLDRLRNMNQPDFRAATLPLAFPVGGNGHALKTALEKLCVSARKAVHDGHSLLILSDLDLPPESVPVPALLAVSAVNRCLSEEGLRTGTGLIVHTGEAREVMHFALLLGYGATAINPATAFETIADMSLNGRLEKSIGVTRALENYIHAIRMGLLKIMSKMGISTLRSYRGAQVFEAVGLNREMIDAWFPGTATRIEGIGLDDIAAETQARYDAAVRMRRGAPDSATPSGGRYRYRRDGERHLWTPQSINLLQRATRCGDHDIYRQYAQLINDQSRAQSTLRGLFKLIPGTPVPLKEVEPEAQIVKRFATGAMSFGSLSREAHETIAIAMNRLGAMSNSGEGGEDPARFKPLPNGDSRLSAIKQVASGRFGVTIEYLVSAREIQIKIAQGAKPGEGGQLPGHKVDAEIARVRYSTPGVTLISPPPHHDIYSIEDLAQLIFDLRNANPSARISVKLVSELGVGTIAAGVAKAHADMILISGGDGGTGAAPLSSLRHAGIPWEIGLADTQQTLALNNLRDRVRVQVDSQIKTGRDVVIAALLGAEEFGFATAALVVCGCVMMRHCHNNTCPVGVATQDPRLRRRFTGKPEYLVNFFRMIAGETRELMAVLGFRTIDEMVGRCDRIAFNDAIDFWKARGLDYSRLLDRTAIDAAKPLHCSNSSTPSLNPTLDTEFLPAIENAIARGERIAFERPIRNIHRSVGTRVSGHITRLLDGRRLPDDTITLRFNGSAGQSFGAFAASGVTLILEGEANDYVGKGLSGGRIVLRPARDAVFVATENVIAGNILLYGATGGELYACGQVGERFAIRNSGATAVVEGVGNHACEYMTGGRVAVLGPTGLNFAAGMSGGIAYVYDDDRLFDARCNLETVDLEPLTEEADIAELRHLIATHRDLTGSRKADDILAHWQDSLPRFLKVFPMEYRRALGRMSRDDEAVDREETGPA